MQWSERIGRRIKLRDLHILSEVVQSGSMAKAAQGLAVSTPVVSKTIADLEQSVGVRLLDRSARGIQATMYGRALLRWSMAAFDDLRQGIKEIEFLADPTAGELRIGCPTAMMEGFLPVILNRLHRHHPRLIFDVTQTFTGAPLHRELRERNVDLILGRMTMPVADDFSAEVLFDDPHFVLAGVQNKWVRRRHIELVELVNEPWLLPKPGTATRTVIADTFRACNLEIPSAVISCNSVQMYRTLLAGGPWLGMLETSALRFGAKRPAIKVLPVKLPALPRPVGIITLKGRMISPVAQLFIDYAREVAKPLRK
jgi:DNA-binding transcriptional LysR family regulator